MESPKKGRVFIVGAGPGDPELVTLKAIRLIRSADVVVYDRLIPRDVLREASRNAELVYVGKEPGRHAASQDEINKLLYEKASEGKTVVRLKGGDPYVFGRGEEECLYLVERGVECQVVPGVPSFIGAAAYAGIPLTNRWLASSFAVVTGTEAREKKEKRVDLARIAGSVDTIVVLMGARRAVEVLREIASTRGYKEKAAIVMNATTRSQRVLEGSIEELIEAAERGEIRNPAVIIVGRVVELRGAGLWKTAPF